MRVAAVAGEVSDAELLERHGALELGRMYLGGRKPGEEGEGPSIAPPPPQFPGPLFALHWVLTLTSCVLVLT